MRGSTLVRTALSVTATAVAGGVATDPDSAWYRALRKPPWQPGTSSSWARRRSCTPVRSWFVVIESKCMITARRSW
jgi:hypothetical protein